MSSIAVTLFGGSDREVKEMLSLSDVTLTAQPLSALGGLAASSSTHVPDAVIVDLRGETSVPLEIALLRRQHPGVGVLILASKMDPALMLEAIRAGVNEFLPEPFSSSALSDAVHRVVQVPALKQAEGKVFAFVGAKGGVGTTTIAVNVGAALAGVGTGKSLLIDLHVGHGDAALFLGVEPRFTTSDALENIHRMDEAYLRGLVTATKSGLHLLASKERGTPPVPDSDSVRKLIAFGAQHYRHVLLDVPHSSIAMLDSLELTSNILVVANQELAAVRRAGALALTLRQRYGKERVGVLINRFNPNGEIRREDVERVTGGAVRHLVPNDYRTAVDGLNKGQPIVVENHSRLAASFTSLARALAGIESATPAKQDRVISVFGRLGTAKA